MVFQQQTSQPGTEALSLTQPPPSPNKPRSGSVLRPDSNHTAKPCLHWPAVQWKQREKNRWPDDPSPRQPLGARFLPLSCRGKRHAQQEARHFLPVARQQKRRAQSCRPRRPHKRDHLANEPRRRERCAHRE